MKNNSDLKSGANKVMKQHFDNDPTLGFILKKWWIPHQYEVTLDVNSSNIKKKNFS